MNDGKRQFKAIAIVGGKKGQEPREFCAPCGVCRQVMAEFCGPEFEIVMTDGKELQVKKLEDLLPLAFGPGELAVREKGAGPGARPWLSFAPAALVIPEIFVPPRGTTCV